MIYDDSVEKPESECTHDCSTCSANCASKKKESLIEAPHKDAKIKKVIGIVSGKGGVGKSIVTSMLSVLMNRRGYNAAILDADVTGPSIPKAFNVKGDVLGDGEGGILPLESKTGIKMMSVNLLLSDETSPVVWRGPVIAGTVKQFWTDVVWNEVDFMFVDMPPGTGDIPLTVFQSIPLDGIIIVTSPQELVSMIVSKAANMAKMMNIPVLGLVENFSYFKCPDCGKEHSIFGESHIAEIADRFGYDVLARMPIDPKLAALVDKGMLELMEISYLDGAADALEKLL